MHYIMRVICGSAFFWKDIAWATPLAMTQWNWTEQQGARAQEFYKKTKPDTALHLRTTDEDSGPHY